MHFWRSPRRKGKGGGSILFKKEVAADNFPNVIRDLDIQVHSFEKFQLKKIFNTYYNKTTSKREKIGVPGWLS